MSRTTVVAGVGPRLGTALARTFADAGDRIALLARSPDYVEDLAADLRRDGADAVAVTADVTDPATVGTAFDAVRDAFGPVDRLVHNASAPGSEGFFEASPEEFARPWRVRTLGGFLCAREVLRDVRGTGEAPDGGPGSDAASRLDSGPRTTTGTILFSGTTQAHDGSARLPDWGSAAFATRGLARSLASRFGPDGVHVAYVAIGGAIAPADGYVTEDRMDAAAVADAFLDLAEQPPDAWTQELDLRPSTRPP